MGFFDALFNPSKNTKKGYNRAIGDFDRTRSITDPFYTGQVTSGQAANDLLSNYLGLNGVGAQQQAYDNYLTSPGYDFTFNQGTRAIDNSGAARGMSQSGTSMKALQEYGQGLYAQDMGNYLNRLTGASQGGYNGAAGLTGNSSQYGNLQIGKGNAIDAGNQASFGNIVSLGTAIAGTAMGIPPGMTGGGGGGQGGQALQSLFAGGGQAAPQMPTYYGMNGRVNPYGIY
jgi:hypothetical protein